MVKKRLQDESPKFSKNQRKQNEKYNFFKICLIVSLAGLLGCGDSSDTLDYYTFEPTQWEKFKDIFDFTKDKNTFSRDSTAHVLNLKDIERGFTLINGIDKSHYDSLLKKGTLVWDTLGNLVVKTYDTEKRLLDEKYEIFGFHPFWVGKDYESYDYSLLSYVSWYSYDIDAATGSYSNPEVIEKLRTEGSKMIELAHESNKNCEILLTITNYGEEKTKRFLDNKTNQEEQLIDSILNLVTTLKLDGLDINFEKIAKGYGDEMTQFVKKISKKLKAVNPDYTLSLTIPKLNDGQIDDIESLNDYVDIFVLTEYDFRTRSSKRDEAITSLSSIQSIVDGYLENGVKRDKIILTLSYYKGIHKSASFLNEKSKANAEKIWFEDSITLKTKFDWAKNENLGGVGIWIMGPDKGSNGLWRLLDQTFAIDAPVTVSLKTNSAINITTWLRNYEIPIVITFLFFALFVGLGFLVSLFDWRVRNYLFENKSSRLVFILLVFGLVGLTYLAILFFQKKPIYSGNTSTLVLGLVLGAVLTGLIMKIYQWHRNRLP